MSKKRRAENPKNSQRHVGAHSCRLMRYSLLLSALFLSTSPIAHATPQAAPFTELTAIDATYTQQTNHSLFKPLTPANKTLKSSFIRNIRAAIAAKWHASQLHDLIAAMTSPPDPSAAIPLAPPKPANSFKPFIGQNLSYDSNLLRQADHNEASATTKSDFIKQIRAGIAAKWSIHRQLLLIKAIITQNWFTTHQELDYVGRDIEAQWNWQIGENLSGEIGYANNTSRGSFSQLNSLIDNLQTENRYFANGEYQFLSGWFLRGGISRQNTRYSSALLQTNNLREDAGAIGLKYLTPNSNLLGLTFTQTDGSFLKRTFTASSFVDNAYTRNDYDFNWDWQYSVKTRLNGKVGYSQQNFDHLQERDFSAPTARANLNWEITGKTALALSGWREIGLANKLNANFMLSQGIKLTPLWLASPKLQLALPLSYETQEYLGNPGFVNTASAADQDKISKIGLTIDYNPLDNAKLSLFMLFEDRASTSLSRNYQSKAIGLDMQWDF